MDMDIDFFWFQMIKAQLYLIDTIILLPKLRSRFTLMNLYQTSRDLVM